MAKPEPTPSPEILRAAEAVRKSHKRGKRYTPAEREAILAYADVMGHGKTSRFFPALSSSMLHKFRQEAGRPRINGVAQAESVKDAIIYLRHAERTIMTQMRQGKRLTHEQLMVLNALDVLQGGGG